MRERTTRIRISDHGCMFRGYARSIVDAINQCTENNTFVPALAYTFAGRPVENSTVRHEERSAGESKYSRVAADQAEFRPDDGVLHRADADFFCPRFRVVSLLSVVFGIGLIIRRLVFGANAAEQGLFTLFAIAFLLIGIALFGLGLLGEYIGRIYEEVRRRPRYLIVAAVLEQTAGSCRTASRDARGCLRLSRRRSTLPAGAAGAGRRVVPLVVTHQDAIRTEQIVVCTAWRSHARWHRSGTWPRPEDPKLARNFLHATARRAPRFPVLVLLPADAGCRSCWRWRRAALSTCMARCCQNIRGRVPVNWAVLNGETRDRSDAARR